VLNNIRICRSMGYVLIGLLASSMGCQEKKPSVTPTESASNSAVPLSNDVPTEIDPKSVSDDGTVLLASPEQSTTVAEPNAPRLDVIVEVPEIPTDAKFGTPTLADQPPKAGTSGEPIVAEPIIAEPIVAEATSAEPTLAEPTLAEPTLAEPTLAEPTSAFEQKSARSDSAVVAEASNVELSDPDAVQSDQVPAIGSLASVDELNQKIAEDWPKPQVVLLLTGQQHGYLEPCGCTGLDRQKGGIIRRDTLLTQLTDRGWPVVPLDVGNQVRRTGKQAEIQFEVTADAFKKLNYRAVTLGIDDLRLNSTLLMRVAASDDVVKNPGIFISANTSIYDQSFWPKIQVLEVGGRKIGITAHLGEEFSRDLATNTDIATSDSVSSLQSAVKELKDRSCDYIVLLSHTSQQDSEQVAAKVPGIDLVVTAGGLGEPRNVLDPIPGSSAMLSQVGTKGMYACIIGLFDDAKTPVRYQRIAISSQFKDSPRMLEVFKDYQERLQSEGFEGLGVKYKSAPKSGEFVGSEACGDCHTIAFDVWKDSGHFNATDSIIQPNNARGAIPRHFDPECISCHVTGWDPQKFEPFETGYWSLEKTPKLVGSGCENCHGPGSEHVKAESGDVAADAALLNKLREQMRLPLALAEAKCVECHDSDNSPDFKFDKYWKEVEHVGKD
jgi:Cytochrome c554 and c-prime